MVMGLHRCIQVVLYNNQHKIPPKKIRKSKTKALSHIKQKWRGMCVVHDEKYKSDAFMDIIYNGLMRQDIWGWQSSHQHDIKNTGRFTANRLSSNNVISCRSYSVIFFKQVTSFRQDPVTLKKSYHNYLRGHR